MVDYREILNIDNFGYTKKGIASSIHSSRKTVSEYRRGEATLDKVPE